VKCFRIRIAEDFTNGRFTHCAGCDAEFSRETMIRGEPAYKIIGGKVFVKK